MKILHTADWHIGKKLYNVSRLAEQREVISEIGRICDEQRVDIIIVAGDVYDTCNPSAEAEELFYSAAAELSRGRLFIAISGNHDDPQRLSAAAPLARAVGMVLAGDGDLSGLKLPYAQGGRNYIVVRKGGERVNIALLPFPLENRLPPDEKYDCYADMTRAMLSRGAQCFGDGFNMTAAHLFTAGGETTDGDERMLGTACIVPDDVFPRCDYVALGHIHKPMTVSRSKNIHYSGSILNYHFGDAGEKSVTVIDTADKSFVRVPLKSSRKLVRVTAADFAEAYAKLAAADGYAELIYSGEPLTPTETAAIRKTLCVSVKIAPRAADKTVSRRAVMTDRELFEEFYKSRYGALNEKVTELFMRFIGGEDVTD